MHSLIKPNVNKCIFYYSCIGKRKTSINKNLLNKASLIENAAIEYEVKAEARELYKLGPLSDEELDPLTSGNLINLYTNFSRLKSKNRIEYDKLLASAQRALCCFCSIGEPSELDHFLPKTKFPEFSVLPVNLLPICHWCNKLKLDDAPKSVTESYIHPYFEEYSEVEWLVANLNFIQDYPIATYQIKNDLKLSNAELACKLEYQFKKLELNKRYSERANVIITEMHHRLRNLHKSGGAEKVKFHLDELAKYEFQNNKYSWVRALYISLSKSNEFCELLWLIG